MTAPSDLTAPAEGPETALQTPWARVKNPTPIPDPLQLDELRELPKRQLQLLLRDNLLSRDAEVDGRARWVALWAALADDPELTEMAFDALEDLLDTTENAIKDDLLDEAAGKRARKFLRVLEEAWARLTVDEQRPLGWAGRRATTWDPPSRRVIEQLVLAIAGHRHQLTGHGDAHQVDEHLWKVLADVDLDPAGYRRGPLPPYPREASAAPRRGSVRRRLLPLPAVDPQQPLHWAGTVMAGFRPSSAFPVLEQVVLAIAEHRKATTELGAVRPAIDEPLWAVLNDVGLDPIELIGRS
jgi:hypothetical protein